MIKQEDINMLDVVKLKDGREVTVVEIFNQGEAYMIDNSTYDNDDFMPTIRLDDIAEIIYKHTSGAYNRIIKKA